jgi:uncharacterized membrane protein YhaH (DUF805 family)
MSFLQLLFSYKGRIETGQFWLACGVSGLPLGLSVAGAFLCLAFARTSQSSFNSAAGLIYLIVPILLIGLGAGLWISSAAFTKRLHDHNRGAHWLLWTYLPIILSFLASVLLGFLPLRGGAMFYLPYLTGFIFFGFKVYVFITLGCLKGKDEPNKFDTGYEGAYQEASESAHRGYQNSYEWQNVQISQNDSSISKRHVRSSHPLQTSNGDVSRGEFGGNRLGDQTANTNSGFGRKVS